MALQPLSIGDILMLSKIAYRVGRAFVQRSGPAEFAKVEQEAKNLSSVLKLSAEALRADDSILARADEQTLQAVWAILASAQKSLSDLERFVDRYQVIKKRETSDGYIVERSWSQAVLANYKTLKWTTEGSNIKQLQDMLHMHSNTITLTMQALQTRSLSRLERTVMPLADNVASIHERVSGDLGSKIDDVHRIVMAVASSTPSLQALERPAEFGEHRRQLSTSAGSDASFLLDSPPVGADSRHAAVEGHDRRRCDSAVATLNPPLALRPRPALGSSPTGLSAHAAGSWLIDFDSEGDTRDEATTGAESRPAMSVYSEPRSPSAAESPVSTRRASLVAVNEYAGLASTPWSEIDSDTQFADERAAGGGGGIPAGTAAGRADNKNEIRDPLTMATALGHRRSQAVATPQSVLLLNSERQHVIGDATGSEEYSVPRVNDSSQPGVTFERSLFRNAAILCDTRGTLVEYAQHNRDEADPRYDTEMVAICHSARICVIRKREHREHSGTKLATSIWVLSDDGSVRCQQKLSERSETIPYSSYFEPEKVSIAGPVADGLIIRCHGKSWSDPLENEIKTGWINYVFSSAVDAAAFQSAVFGRAFLGSFRTSKTAVIHDGIRGVFAIEEQFAKMDRLRLFEDDGVATPGAEGGVLALLHVSSTFGDGWTKFWLNSSRQQLYLKKDGERCVKLKGLDLAVPGSTPVTTGPARRPSLLDEHVLRVDTARMPMRRVSGLRIEFETFREREDFLTLCRRVQERMLPLPQL